MREVRFHEDSGQLPFVVEVPAGHTRKTYQRRPWNFTAGISCKHVLQSIVVVSRVGSIK